MWKAGDSSINPITGERGVCRVGSGDGSSTTIADLYVRPGGAVVGEHVHPHIEEKFTVVRGTLSYSLNGQQHDALPGEQVIVPAGAAHDWWNAGDDELHVVVEITPGARFEQMVSNLFGLARDGKTDAKGVPHLLQLAPFALEFRDVLYFTAIPRWVQRVLFSVVLPISWLLGYRGSYAKYTQPPASPSFNAGRAEPVSVNTLPSL